MLMVGSPARKVIRAPAADNREWQWLPEKGGNHRKEGQQAERSTRMQKKDTGRRAKSAKLHQNGEKGH